MNLIFIYGPPAVGKLTVAKELAALTGYKLFHNHLTIDVVNSIFERGTMSFFRTLRKIRLTILEEAAQADIPGIIMTFVYSPTRLEAVEQYEKTMAQYGGEICFVRLFCDEATLAQRVKSEERGKYGKITSAAKLDEKLKELKGPFAVIPDRDSLYLDVGELLPVDAAKAIQKHYQLPVNL